MSKPQKGTKKTEGKTKIIWHTAEEDDPRVIVENKPQITAHDDPDLTRRFANKAKYATTTTCRVFELLTACGIPNAYIEQLDETSFLAHDSQMILLEIVARRYAVGSFLKRHPELVTEDKTKPHRFHRLRVEFFLKTTGGRFNDLSMPQYAENGKLIDDPLIVNPDADEWFLAHPKAPSWEPGRVKGEFPRIPRNSVVTNNETISLLDIQNRKTALVLDRAWAMLGLTWVDHKIECDHLLRVSDVVDGDSWRLWRDGEDYSKQTFRDGGEAVLDEVERKYGYIAQLAERLVLPRQALVLWRGSINDRLPPVPELPGVDVKEITVSAHKGTHQVLMTLERLLADYPQGGVIIAIAGRSNGLGPVLASHSPWPVISAPPGLKNFPEDIWSSIRMPSGTPNLTAWPAENAVGAAMQILGQTNSAVYMIDQLEREKRDDYVA